MTIPPTPAQRAAHDRFDRVAWMLRRDWPAADIARAVDLSLPATYNLIARTRRHFGQPLSAGGLRPAGSRHSPGRYVKAEPDGDEAA